jgi:hypothetical protein
MVIRSSISKNGFGNRLRGSMHTLTGGVKSSADHDRRAAPGERRRRSRAVEPDL